MRAAERKVQELSPATLMAEIEVGIAALFQRCPTLSGFTVQDPAALALDVPATRLDNALCVADVAIHAWPGDAGAEDVRTEIACTLLDLVEQHPGACALLRDRTFARTLH
jgi:hypothetical protein